MARRLDIDRIMANAEKAASEFQQYSQQQTDHIVRTVYEAGYNARVQLAKLACEETGLGLWKDKVIKNVIATRFVYNDIKRLKTVGIVNEDLTNGIVEIAHPIGPIFAITPITNPTSTVLFKILISLKTRNSIVIRPHGSARKCSTTAARICYEAALNAGAPKNCIQWISRSSKEQTLKLMGHESVALILATGSVSLVRAAHRSGNPVIGVGPGNVPVYISESADVPFAVDQIIMSKTFDNGTVCASEQAVVVHQAIADPVIAEFKARKGYFLSEDEVRRLEPVAFNKNEQVMNTEVIGQSVQTIARLAGFDTPRGTSLLIAQLRDVGVAAPLSLEILAPILAFYTADGFTHGIALCEKINRHGGLGHTISIFSADEKEIQTFAETVNAGRILVNTPASQGALGGTFNRLPPSLTLGCGSGGKNITTDNISAKHLLNIQRVAKRKNAGCFDEAAINHYCDESNDASAMENFCGLSSS